MIIWKPIQMTNMDGEMYWSKLGFLNEDHLLLEKLSLLDGKPMPFENALLLYNEALLEGLDTASGMMASIYKLGFAGWLKLQGYKAILTGNEYSEIEEL